MRLGASLFSIATGAIDALIGSSATALSGRREERGRAAAMFTPAPRLLTQYLVRCPRCEKPAAAHLDESNPKTPVLVRLVCPDACRVDESAVLSCLPRAPQHTKECS